MKKSIAALFLFLLFSMSSAYAEQKGIPTRGLIYIEDKTVFAFMVQSTDALEVLGCHNGTGESPTPPNVDGKPAEEYILKYCKSLTFHGDGMVKTVYQTRSNRFIFSTGTVGQEFQGTSCSSSPGSTQCDNPKPAPALASTVTTMTLNLDDVSNVPAVGAIVLHVSGENPRIESGRSTFLKTSEATFLFPEIKEKAIRQ